MSLLRSAGVCRDLLGSAVVPGVCCGLLRSTAFCRCLLRSAEICRGLLRSAGVYKGLKKFIGVLLSS